MSEADFTDIDPTASISALRRALNSRTTALRSFEASATPPSSAHANQFHVDSVNGIFAQRNDDNTEWIFQWLVGQAAHSLVRIPEPLTPSSVVIRTELDTLLNVGGFTDLEEQGADVFMNINGTGSLGSIVSLPVPATYPRWSGRLFAISMTVGDASGGVIRIRLEGSSTDAAVLSRPGDFWIGRIDAANNWEVLASNASEGYREVSLTGNVDNFTGLEIVDTSGGSVTRSLPDLSTLQNIRGPITFKKTSAANTMTIDTAGSELIDGAASVSSTALHSSFTIAVHAGAYYVTAQI